VGERKGLRLEEVNSAMLSEVKSYSQQNAPEPVQQASADKKDSKTIISVHIDADLLLAIRTLRLHNKCNVSELVNKNLGQMVIDEVGANNISAELMSVLKMKRV